MKSKLFFLLAVSFTVILLDQISKAWIEHNVSFYQSIQIIPNFFHITHIKNTGGAFGILAEFNGFYFKTFFILFTLLSIGVVGFFYWRLKPNQDGPALGIALIIGGAIGNLIDRVRLGGVIDFIDVHYYSLHWPAFNVADSAITIGSALLGVLIFLKKW
ncbi:MAG: signal peptidase II [Thermodesulfobacteriota bacterium]|nr:MAG: signal peptidase II [Thermodesulfobacteriota bacterium]